MSRQNVAIASLLFGMLFTFVVPSGFSRVFVELPLVKVEHSVFLELLHSVLVFVNFCCEGYEPLLSILANRLY